MKQKSKALSNKKFKIAFRKVLVTILILFAIALFIIIAKEVQFRNRYELPESLRRHLLNGPYPYDPTIYINDEAYTYCYFSESRSEEYFSELPDTFEELSHEDNDLKIVSGYIRGLDEDFKETWLEVKEELTGKVYMSGLHPNVALLYFDEKRNGQAFSEPERYYYLIKSELFSAEVTYRGDDYEFNFLTHAYTPEYLPKDLRELPTGSVTVSNEFLSDQPAYTSRKTGMIYIEVFEDTVYIPFERPEYIKAMLRYA